MYTDESLDDMEILDRALRLLYQAQFGHMKLDLRISPHIIYDQLPLEIAHAINAKLKIEESEMIQLIEVLEKSEIS